MSVPNPCVVDTNVCLTANNKSTAGPNCVRASIGALQKVMASGHVVLDEGWEIIREYRHELSEKGQPGVGDAFLKWVLTNHANPKRCSKVSLTPKPDDPADYLEFPDHEDLIDFDRSDRKFVAVAAVHANRPAILQSFDSKWWGWKDGLQACGVRVQFLCPAEIEQKYNEKIRKQ